MLTLGIRVDLLAKYQYTFPYQYVLSRETKCEHRSADSNLVTLTTSLIRSRRMGAVSFVMRDKLPFHLKLMS